MLVISLTSVKPAVVAKKADKKATSLQSKNLVEKKVGDEPPKLIKETNGKKQAKAPDEKSKDSKAGALGSEKVGAIGKAKAGKTGNDGAPTSANDDATGKKEATKGRSVTPKKGGQKKEADSSKASPEKVALEAAKKGNLGTVTTPGGRRSTRIAQKKAAESVEAS